MTRIVSWFSCGAASAYATYLASQKYGNIEAVYCRVRQEHPSNMKFLEEFQRKTNIAVTIIENQEFKGDIFNVFLKRKFLKNQYGAPCTMILKKDMRKEYQQEGDVQIFGYPIEEEQRMLDFCERNKEVVMDNILIDKAITKNDCKQWVLDMGFELPIMYQLGYQNNNCIGCVKGGMGYWNAIRKDFPEAFDKMAKTERLIGHAVNKSEGEPVYLDELEPTRGNFKRDQPSDCGFLCDFQYDFFKQPMEQRNENS